MRTLSRVKSVGVWKVSFVMRVVFWAEDAARGEESGRRFEVRKRVFVAER